MLHVRHCVWCYGAQEIHESPGLRELSGVSLKGIVGIVLREKINEEMVYVEIGHLGRPCKENYAGYLPTPAFLVADECPDGQLTTGTVWLFV